MTCSPRFIGGARAHSQLRETLSSTLARVVATPAVVVSNVYEKMQDGRFLDQGHLKHALEAIKALIVEVTLLRTARSMTQSPYNSIAAA